MNISEAHRCPCGDWQETPGWLQWFGKPRFRRPLYAWPQIGGGWDGWEYDELSRRHSEGSSNG